MNTTSDRAKRKAHYEANKEQIRAKQKVYYEANKDKKRVYRKAYYEANKQVLNAQGRAYNRANKTIRNAKRYGLTEVDYNRMSDTQGFVCAICGWVIESEDGKANTLHIDHCHETNTVRSLLCSDCNVGLGCFKDNTNLLRKAVAYLDYFTFINQTERVS